MSHNSETEVQAFGCGTVLATVVILGCTAIVISQKYVKRSEAVEHGAAYYHPETGEFTWKDEVTNGH